ncbi:MAG: hypothetical protein N3H31_01790 [Candidatus Nezhaarchaeota archaeon]|nr:hypothetical protein [Candidatus Nezhaarchaeota archaeon]
MKRGRKVGGEKMAKVRGESSLNSSPCPTLSSIFYVIVHCGTKVRYWC